MSVAYPTVQFPWANEANYPAGSNPWSGQPVKSAPLEDILTPGRTQPAEELNSVLHSRDVALKDVIDKVNLATGEYLYSSGLLKLVTSLKVVPADSAYAVAEQDGLEDTISSLTPFTSGVQAGDVIELIIPVSVIASGTETYSDPSTYGSVKVVYSETATAFTTGSWTNCPGAPGFQGLVALSSDQLVTQGLISVRIVAGGGTGHLRAALAGYDGGASKVFDYGLAGNGIWKWYKHA